MSVNASVGLGVLQPAFRPGSWAQVAGQLQVWDRRPGLQYTLAGYSPTHATPQDVHSLLSALYEARA
eukprot:15440775-Alexandrium_andersonii.AAC.1